MSLRFERGYIRSDYDDTDYEWDVDFKLSNNAIAFLFGILSDYAPEPDEIGIVDHLMNKLNACATNGTEHED